MRTAIPTAAYLGMPPSCASLRNRMWKRNVQILPIHAVSRLKSKKKYKYFFIQCSSIFGTALRFGKFPGLARLSFWQERRSNVLSTGGMIMIWQHRSTGRKTCPSVTWPTTNLTWTDLESNTDIRCESPATKRPNRATAHLKAKISPNYVFSVRTAQ